MESVVMQYLPSVIMIIIGLVLGNWEKKRTARAEKYQVNMSAMFAQLTTCITANNEGVMALARAVKDGDTNGGLTAAMGKIAMSNESFNAFLRDLATNNVVRR